MAPTPKREPVAYATGGRYGGVRTDGDNSPLDFFDVDGELLRDCVANVINAGDCIMFALTSDHGAVMIRVISGGVSDAFYPPTTEAIEVALRGIRDTAKQ